MSVDNNTNSSQARTISLMNNNLYAAASGGHDGCCPPVVDPYTLLALLVGIALATYFLRVLITVTMFGKRRKKRQDEDVPEPSDVQQLLLEGLEEFEDNNDDQEVSNDSDPWYITAVNSLMQLKEEAEDDLICDVARDTTTGLWKLNKTSTIYQDRFSSTKCEQKQAASLKITNEMLHGKGRCTVEVWRCFSTVLEGMVNYVEEPKQIFGVLSEALYKVTFHGTHKTIWNSIMEIPEVHRVCDFVFNSEPLTTPGCGSSQVYQGARLLYH